MKILLKITLIISLLLPMMSFAISDSQNKYQENLLAVNNLDSWNIKPEWNSSKTNDHLNNLQTDDGFITAYIYWERGIKNLLIRAAKDIKSIALILASIYLLVLILRLLFLDKTDEEVAKFKKWVLWTTLWIIVMQITYGFISILFDKDISERLAYSFIDNLVSPLISLVETAASFFFLAIAIYAYYKLVTSDWDEEKAKTWKKSIIYAVVWFVVIKFSKLLVEATYWKLNPDCEASFWFSFVSESCVLKAEVWGVADIIITIINWANWFISIIVLLMVIYAWSIFLLSAWDEEKLKKWKSIILYVIVWMALLVTNYLILTFFLLPENVI